MHHNCLVEEGRDLGAENQKVVAKFVSCVLEFNAVAASDMTSLQLKLSSSKASRGPGEVEW